MLPWMHLQPDPPRPAPRRLIAAGLLCGVLAPLLLPLDVPAVRFLNPASAGLADAVLGFLNEMMPVIILSAAVVAGGWFWVAGGTPGRRRAGLLLCVSPFLANRITGVIKDLVARARPQHPEHAIDGLRILAPLSDFESFPSGHVTTAAAFAFAAGALLPRRVALVLAALLVPAMMWARVAAAAHFPSDVLAGAAVAAFTVAAGARLLHGRDPRLAPKWRVPAAALGLLAVTAAWPAPLFPLDPVALDPEAGFLLRPRPWRTACEPVIGPALELAYAPDPCGFVLRLAPWAAAALAALAFLPRRSPGRDRRRRVFVAGGWMLLVALLGWRGDLPADRFTAPAEREGVFFDPHVHAGDPVDGSMDLPAMLARAAARGVDVVAVTNHDAPPATTAAIPGTEWSGGRHPEQPFLHLLVLGGDGAVAAVNAREVPRLGAGPGPARSVALEAVREAKARGAVVIVAHWWRTRRQMAAARDASGGPAPLDHHLPDPVELADAGVDGFEVANRHWDADSGDRERVAAIDRLCRERKLLRLASSDDHGRPAGSPCVTFLPGRFPEESSARRAAVFDHLRRRGPSVPLVFHRERRAREAPAFLAGPVAAWRYLVALGPGARISFLLWFLVAWRMTVRKIRDSGPSPVQSGIQESLPAKREARESLFAERRA